MFISHLLYSICLFQRIFASTETQSISLLFPQIGIPSTTEQTNKNPPSITLTNYLRSTNKNPNAWINLIMYEKNEKTINENCGKEEKIIAMEGIRSDACLSDPNDSSLSYRIVCDNQGNVLITQYQDHQCRVIENVYILLENYCYFNDNKENLFFQYTCQNSLLERDLDNVPLPVGDWNVVKSESGSKSSWDFFQIYREGECYAEEKGLGDSSFKYLYPNKIIYPDATSDCSGSHQTIVSNAYHRMEATKMQLSVINPVFEGEEIFVNSLTHSLEIKNRFLQSTNTTDDADDDGSFRAHVHPPPIVFIFAVLNIVVPIMFCLFCVCATRSYNGEDESSFIHKLMSAIAL